MIALGLIFLVAWFSFWNFAAVPVCNWTWFKLLDWLSTSWSDA